MLIFVILVVYVGFCKVWIAMPERICIIKYNTYMYEFLCILIQKVKKY